MDDSKQSRYDSERLIQVATIANEISRASGLSTSGSIKRLVQAVECGELCSDLYLPVQKIWHGRRPERLEVPIANGANQWQSIAKHSVANHQSDKDKFGHPPSASVYHVLANDLFEYSKACSIGAMTKEALRQLAVRYNPELGINPVTPPDIEPVQPEKNSAPGADLSKSASDGPAPLTTGDIAHCFDKLRWSESEWRKPLGDKPKWLSECVAVPGQRGVSETRWNPVLIGAALVQQGHVQSRSVRSKFQTVDLLKPWLDAWNTYEADNIDEV